MKRSRLRDNNTPLMLTGSFLGGQYMRGVLVFGQTMRGRNMQGKRVYENSLRTVQVSFCNRGEFFLHGFFNEAV